MKKSASILFRTGIVVFLIIVGFFIATINSDTKPVRPSKEQQNEFYEYAVSNQLPNKELVYKVNGVLGCDESESGKSWLENTGCTLSSTYIYKLEGNYRDNGKEIFAFLKTRGFDFRQDSKYKTQTEEKLNNSSFAANLSDTEPIIVDLYNTRSKIRVRVNLGDKGRTMPYAQGQALNELTSEQLIVGLQFYKS